MSDFFYRTEDISSSEVLKYFVETDEDRSAINQLKSRNPTVLVGSRGVGKSFLMRVAEAELKNDFATSRIVPVYVTFVSSSLLRTADPDQFRNWMLARICTSVLRTVRKMGLMSSTPHSANILAGLPSNHVDIRNLEAIVSAYESSWKDPGKLVDVSTIPDIEDVKNALEDLSDELRVARFTILMDEAAHIFLPTQQRQFFTLFRDLRSPSISCNAAVYPGVTSYGDTFQPTHDATMVSINRDVLSSGYVDSMRQIVEKQADSTLLKNIARNGKNFSILAYAATGNPRLLLKTVFNAPKLSSTEVNATIREFYLTGIWAEHSALSEKYVGHKSVVDWGRNFMEDIVLPDLKSKNDTYLEQERNSTAFLWIHRDAPEIVKESLRILCYTGVLTEQADGIRATRGEVGKRYTVNLGCMFSLEATPSTTAFDIAKSLTLKRLVHFGANHSAYTSLTELKAEAPDIEEGFELRPQLEKSNRVLDITDYQRTKLNELQLITVGDVLAASEDKLKEAYYIGDVRARQMRNAAVASVLEYLSG